MILSPSVPGLILCERVDVNRDNGQFSLIGLFHTRRFPTFPAPGQSFTAYAALFDGLGEGTLELRVQRLVTAGLVHRYRRWAHFPQRGLTVHMEIRIRQCVFPTPGVYELILSFDGKDLTHRYLEVYQG